MKTEYPNLDLLRAVAVTFVTVSHVFTFFGLGHGYIGMWGILGVAIFFVHTSLVLTQSLDYQERPLYIPFMIRRCFRIYPLAVTILATVVLFRIPQLFSEQTGHFVSRNFKPHAIVANFLLLQDLLSASPAYSRPTQGFPVVTSIIGPMWSLSVEMLMYAVLPLLFLLVNRQRYRAAALTGMYLMVVMFSIAGVRSYPFVEFFSYAPVFAAGIVAYYLLRGRYFIVPAFCWPIFLAVMCFALPTSRIPLLYWGLVVAATLPWFAQITSKPLVLASKLIARYSYGIYLTHCLCMWIALEKMPGPAPLRLTVFLVLLGVVSVGLYHSVEEPMIQIGKRVATKYSEQRLSSLALLLPKSAVTVSTIPNM
jgi:peptidoglycan/LPS O-acetylase OafA/YrhL